MLQEASEGRLRVERGGEAELLAEEDGGAPVQPQRDGVPAAEAVEEAKEAEAKEVKVVVKTKLTHGLNSQLMLSKLVKMLLT